MQITVNRADLDSAVKWAARVRRPCIPILAGISVTVAEGRLTLASFDYDVSVKAHVFGDNAAGGSALVPGGALADAVKAMPKGKNARVTITGDDAGLTLASGPATCRVAQFTEREQEDYPQLPAMPAHAGMVAGAAFARAVTRVSAAAGTDETLPVLTCIALEMGERVTLAATDRYRLATDVADWTPAVPGAETETAAVPAKDLVRFVKAAKGAGKISVHYDVPDVPESQRGFGGAGTLAGFATDEREMVIRTSAGTFPRWRALLPSAFATIVTADSAVLAAAVRRAGAVCERAESVRLHANGAIHVEVQRDGAAVTGEDVPAERSGPEITAAFNPAYLASLLAGVAGTVRLGFADAKKPAHITAADDADQFRALVCSISIGS